MNSIKHKIDKLMKITDSLASRFKVKTNESSHLIRSNRSTNLALVQYVTASTIIGTMKTYKKFKDLIDGKKPVVKEYPKDTVILFQFPRAYYLPSNSPFALRLETWCRAANIKYQSVGTIKMSSQGLIPYIKLNNIVVEDSGVCIDYLSRVFKIDMDEHLTKEQKAQSQAILKLCELSLFMCMGLHRFWYARNGRKDINVPLLGYWFFSYRVYRRAYQAGYGRLPPEELYEIGRRDLTALNTLLGEKKFLFSDSKPCNTDFMLFGICAEIKFTDRGPLNLHFISECKNLNRHVETMKELYWPDWEKHTLAYKLKQKAISDASKKQ